MAIKFHNAWTSPGKKGHVKKQAVKNIKFKEKICFNFQNEKLKL